MSVNINVKIGISVTLRFHILLKHKHCIFCNVYEAYCVTHSSEMASKDMPHSKMRPDKISFRVSDSLYKIVKMFLCSFAIHVLR